jgi:hypothetical protein
MVFLARQRCKLPLVAMTNFDPGPWGERYLEMVKRLADKGYGYPPESPRDIYRHPHAPASTPKQS